MVNSFIVWDRPAEHCIGFLLNTYNLLILTLRFTQSGIFDRIILLKQFFAFDITLKYHKPLDILHLKIVIPAFHPGQKVILIIRDS